LNERSCAAKAIILLSGEIAACISRPRPNCERLRQVLKLFPP
jgi:hypothetical protein